MMIEGRRQRFCQQCGRFHDISEFEGAKRSCKRKLKRHNERRRTSMTAAKKTTWQSDSEAEAEDAYANESSESEAKMAKMASTKRRTRQPPPQKLPPAVPLPAGAREAPISGDCSAASQNTGSGRVAAAMAADSPSATACAPAHSPSPTAPPPLAAHMLMAMPSMSGSLDTSLRRADTADAHTLAADVPVVESPGQQHAAAPMEAPEPAPAAPLPRQLFHAQQQQQQEKSPQAMDVQPSLATINAPPSPTPVSALASAPTGPYADHVLDTVLQQLLQDEELQGLQLDPLEMFLPQDRHQMGIKSERIETSGLQPVVPGPSPRPAVPGPSSWNLQPAQPAQHARQMQQAVAHASAAAGYAPLAAMTDLPMELLDDIPIIPLPEELVSSGTTTRAPPSAAASGRSGATAVATPSVSGASDMAGIPVAGVDGRRLQQHHSQWHVASACPPPQPLLMPQRQAVPPMPHRVAPSVLASAHSLLSMPGMVASGLASPVVGYGMHPAQETLTTLSLKVFSCTPDRLLPAVRAELESLLNVGQTLLEGYIRPGCTQLTLNALMPQQHIEKVKAGGLGALVTNLLSSCGNSDVLQQDMLIQFEGELAVVKRRKVVALITLKNSPALVPALGPLLPLAVHATAEAPASTPLLLRGNHLTDERDLILARQQGNNLTVEVHTSGTVQGGEYAKVRILGLVPGFADVEVQHGTFLSPPRALLALPCKAAMAEVRQLERCTLGIKCVDGMLRDIGLVVQYLQRHELAAVGQASPCYTPSLLACIADRARRLVAAAVSRGWVATVKMLLPAVTADGQLGSEAIAAMNACCPSGMSLLHVAVGTGNVALIQQLAAWAATAGCRWEVDAHGGSSGVTPLHVAALLPNSTDMRAALAEMAPATTKLWGLVQSEDGTTPEALAEAAQAAAAAAAATTTQASSGSVGSTCEISEARATAVKASSSKAAALPESSLSALSNSSQAARLQASSSKSKAVGQDEACHSSFDNQRRRGRRAIKQHLDDMHMTTILSEVESGLDNVAHDPRPLADMLSSTLAAGAALLRALKRAPS